MYNVLVVDGRGASQAIIAAKIIQIINERLQENSNKDIAKHFDYVVASSTSSLPAALLASGKNPEKVFSEVKDKFYDSFSHNKKKGSYYVCSFVDKNWNKITNYLKSFIWDLDKIKPYTQREFNELFKDFPDLKIKDTQIPLTLLAAKNNGKIISHCFSNKETKLSDAVKSSVAEKYYFPHHEINKHGYFDYSFISKSSLEQGLYCLKKSENLTDQLFNVVQISFDNLNLEDYLKGKKLSAEKYYDIKASINNDYSSGKFLEGAFWKILVTEGNGISKDLHKFDKILNEQEIINIIEASTICYNLDGEYNCKPFFEGLDELINNGLMNNKAHEYIIDSILDTLNAC
ncbi:patatin-like phospholipase family protein [Rickettsiales endosymbiont of Trichoplax sp. H2]|uniref:patatin-like phospholipase family protein n=1 Tax=Rickettsiales endosymbiont of Trichoplax sp. H2 TaxID=2021221 RepID=UPI0012B27626|nr:patatin-like phospholipase family protein [Rickettsiales endosymbiont of Trichoplax sp. H2]MSO13791.1 hypothetical protein [Rickettsiales endosymbiont of Trichoplax sp. H2]